MSMNKVMEDLIQALKYFGTTIKLKQAQALSYFDHLFSPNRRPNLLSLRDVEVQLCHSSK